MDEKRKARRKSMIDEPTKRSIREYFNIDPDSELMNPLVDFTFKRIFTADEKRSKTALIDFINSILEFEGDRQIVELTVVNPQIPVDKVAQKKSIFDIRAKYNDGEQIIIEMQKGEVIAFEKRSQHIISKAYVSQPISGSDYDALKKCYLICVTNFDMIKGTNDYIKDYRYRDRHGRDLSDDETIVFLDLTKIDGVLEKDVSEMTNIEMWALFLKHVTDGSKGELLNRITERQEGIRMAKNILIEVSQDEAARAQYESELIFELDQNTKLSHALKRRDFEIAKVLLEMGDSLEKIVKVTKLSVEEIQKLIEK